MKEKMIDSLIIKDVENDEIYETILFAHEQSEGKVLDFLADYRDENEDWCVDDVIQAVYDNFETRDFFIGESLIVEI